jgi:hypothetical protein
MSYEFQKLSEVEALTEVPEGASVLAEVNGDIKRIPGDGLGGSVIKTAIIKSSDYDEAIAVCQSGGAAPTSSVEPELTYYCINMTFEEAYETMASGEPLNAICMLVNGPPVNMQALPVFVGVMFGVPCIAIDMSSMDMSLFWTADGISTETPFSGGDK